MAANVSPLPTPDAYADLRRHRAGDARKPSLDEDPGAMLDFEQRLIRVLDDDGRAVGPWAPDLPADALVAGFRHMLTVRAFDRRMLAAQRQGKTSFYIQCTGEEAVACAFQAALRDGDMSFPTYRQQGLLIASGYPLVLMAAQVYSNAIDPVRGRQMPIMYSSRDHGFFSVSGNLATQYVQAVGWAMAAGMRGDSRIAAGWIGDGATAESDFHSALVFASTFQPPVILCIVNNQWAISTKEQVARGKAPSLAARAHAYGIPALRADGNDYLAVHAVTSWAAERARAGLGPTLVEWLTYRVCAHSTSDDPSAYRSDADLAAWPLGDPIERLQQHLAVREILDDEGFRQLSDEVDAEVLAAQREAESHGTLHDGERLSPELMFEDVFAEPPPHLRAQRREAGFS
jgi:2-oxoisovalerate dehydrogenase E1 component alpha subunit